MTQSEPFTDMLTGGHPNSLGRTVEVVDIILADQSRLEELFAQNPNPPTTTRW